MQIRHSRSLLWGTIIVILLVLLGYLLKPRPVLTEIGQIVREDMRQVISEEGKTRVQDMYVLSAPVTGFLRRISSEVGDAVTRSDTVVAQIESIDPAFLDPRSEAQVKAEIEAANSSLAFAEAEMKQAEAELEFAEAELHRIRELSKQQSVSARELDNAQRTFKTRRAILATAQARLDVRQFELQQVEAQLLSPAATLERHGQCQCLNLTAPVDGRILSVLRKSEGVVQAGTALVEIGDPGKLEIIVDLLSFDAVKVQAGQRVFIRNWGGEHDLTGSVQRIEPIGFTEVSALGIEEQRVNVVIALTDNNGQSARLGHGYQLDVDIVLWQGEDVLTVPVTALFREGENWLLYAVEEGVAVKRSVTLGHMNGFVAEVLDGIVEGEAIVTYPSNHIRDGVEVAPRVL